MNKTKMIAFPLLQIFADEAGAAEAAGQTVQKATGGTSQIGSDNQSQLATGNAEQNVADVDKKQAFLDLIRGEYKDEYEENFNSRFDRRIKSKNAQIKRYEEYQNKINPMLEKIAAKYGVADVSDIDRIIAEVDKDNSYYHAYAISEGVTEEQAKLLLDAERIRRADAQRQQDEYEMAEFRKRYDGWMQQAQAVSQKYPSFNFEIESQNEQFRNLLDVGIDVETAYTVLHQDEIMSGALQYGYERSKQEMADSRTLRNQRPNENGVSSQQAAGISDDINSLNDEQREKINAAVKRGEIVTPENFRRFL